MNPEETNAIHAVLDRLLLEQGEYRPVEYLLAQNRLQHGDYEAWRSGAIPFLHETLAGSPSRILAQLTEAADYATRLGLQAHKQVVHAWGNQGEQTLRFASDDALEALLSTRFQADDKKLQLDLFMDNSAQVLTTEAVNSLASRSWEQAEQAIIHLRETDPGSIRLDALALLHESSFRLTAPVADTRAELNFLVETLAPTASDTLCGHARDYLAPFWARLAQALRGTPFAENSPALHASYALEQACDWQGVRDACQEDRSFAASARLRLRHACALFNLGFTADALQAWCALCHDFPGEMAAALNADTFPDKELRAAWLRYDNLDAEPELEISFFPAWLLLERSELRNQPALVVKQPEAPANQACLALHALLQQKPALDMETLRQRKMLQLAHPALFAIYLHVSR
ncbi:MAG: hypothetical protein Q8O37_03330 [Sulfuricellaceae bacterium]|nr:hypothetical protein [Sulfuricellaceae bacterium]